MALCFCQPQKIIGGHAVKLCQFDKGVVADVPYGYCKSEKDRHKLVADEYAAGIVRRIFEMQLTGTAYAKITTALNAEGIASPRLY